MVLHKCACVYLWYASNMVTFIADRFASFYVLCNINRKQVKQMLNILCWYVEFVVIVLLS